jgi:mono/diheme cytochrome c family protein
MDNPSKVIVGAVLTLVLAGASSLQTSAHQTGRKPAPLVLQSMSGDDLFRFYCASCHGVAGKGDGPVASALNSRPPDLTIIARQNGGTFPADRVERFVRGDREPTAAHGSAAMPVWGPIFQALDPQDSLNRIRIANVVAFVESIQAK